jgi:hypothetical protein
MSTQTYFDNARIDVDQDGVDFKTFSAKGLDYCVQIVLVYVSIVSKGYQPVLRDEGVRRPLAEDLKGSFFTLFNDDGQKLA